MSSKNLCVIQTDTMNDLLESAKKKLIQSDYNFAAEIEMAEKSKRDASIVVRRAIRDFLHHIASVSEKDWKRFAEIYQTHRTSGSLTQKHFRLEESGLAQLESIRKFIEKQDRIAEIVSVREFGQALPSVMLVIFALIWESERG